jgi:uncharacterized oxidoreductase
MSTPTPPAIDHQPWPTTLITGASSGIGWALAQQLAQSGTTVIALGRNTAQLDSLAAQYPQVHALAFDLADTQGVAAMVQNLVARHPDLACVINNAGIQYNLAVQDEGYGHEQIAHEIAVNLTAPVVLTQALLAHLRAQPAAWVVNIGSGLGYSPKRTSAVYSATKAGLQLFTQALAVQLAGTQVRAVHAVMPLVDTAMTAGRGSGKLSAEAAAAQVLLGLRQGQKIIWVGKAKAVPWLMRLAPSVLARVMQRA